MREHGTYGFRVGVGSSPPDLAFPAGARLTHVEIHVGVLPAVVRFFRPRGGAALVNAIPAGTGRVDMYPVGDLPIERIEFIDCDYLLAEFVS